MSPSKQDVTCPWRITGYGWAWLALCLALTLHITDEALTDFLSVYNPTVLAIRQRLPFLPLPTFNFEVWLSGLIVAVILLLSLAPFAFRQVRWMVAPAYTFAILMFANSIQHIVERNRIKLIQLKMEEYWEDKRNTPEDLKRREEFLSRLRSGNN